MSSSPERDDAGAVAVMTVILSIVLFAVAALAVDLGSAWASKRSAQSQVDLAALSAGDLLPATTPARRTEVATRVAEYLNKVENRVRGQAAVSPAQLLDSDLTNGDAAMPADGKTLTVTAPLARVDFMFAGAAGLPASTTVSAAAKVGVFSQLPGSDVMPFYVPDCSTYGSAISDTTNAGPTAPPTPGTPGSGTGRFPSTFNATAQPDNATQYEDQKVITFRVTGVNGLRSTSPPVVQFEKRTGLFTSKKWAVTGAWTSTAGNQVWEFTAVIGSLDVTALSGQWDYQVAAASTNWLFNTVYSYEGNFNVQPSSPPAPVPTIPTSCGSFGQLESPRSPVVANAKTNLAVNLAEGLDHQLTVRPGAVADECADPPRAGEQLDSVSRAGNNCVRSDTGDDSTALAEGLVRGTAGYAGRLNASRGSTLPGCHGGINVSVAGTSINNDVLSCFMIDGSKPLSALTVPPPVPTSTVPAPRLLNPAVMRSPRFVWIPEVYRADRTSTGYQPIERFVPAFITDETATSTRLAETASADNGIACNGTRASCASVKTITVFTFHPGWLPLDERAPVTAYDPDLGRTTWRLVS